MKAEKFIKLVVDYEHIDISPEWVAFSVSRTLEHTTKLEGIVDRATWNQFLQDPFSTIDYKKIISNHIILLKEEDFPTCPLFNQTFQKDYTGIMNLDMETEFNYSSYKENPDKPISHAKYLSYKIFSSYDNCRDFHYLTNLNNEVVYYNTYIDLPFVGEGQDTEGIFKSLLNMLQNYPESFTMIPLPSAYHKTREEYIQGFENAIDAINDPYIASENDFSAPTPEFMQALGTLKFMPAHFKDFHEFFVCTKKYVEVDDTDIANRKFSLILSLAMLKSFFNDVVSEEFYQFFPEEYKIAKSVALDYKLKPKNNDQTKRMKI